MSVSREKRIALLNPNTSVSATNLMTRIAQAHVSANVRVTGYSMLLGPMVVTDEEALAVLTGGGPLAAAALDIADRLFLPILEPVSEGAKLASLRVCQNESQPG